MKGTAEAVFRPFKIELFRLFQSIGIEFDDRIQNWPLAVVCFNPFQVELTEFDRSQFSVTHPLLEGFDVGLFEIHPDSFSSNSGVGQNLQ